MNAAPSPASPPPGHLSTSDIDISPRALGHEFNLPNAKMVMKTNLNHHRAYKSNKDGSKPLNTALRRQGHLHDMPGLFGGSHQQCKLRLTPARARLLVTNSWGRPALFHPTQSHSQMGSEGSPALWGGRGEAQL